MLNTFARDLCREAREGRLPPVVGREAVLQAVVGTLCRRIKRNVALVGPAGVGKTAIVEGLAQRIVRGEVPPVLRDARVMALSLTGLMSGVNYGEFFQRVEGLLKEAAQEGIILFIDEAHVLMDVGYSRTEASNLANLLKGPLSRGQMACIIATTEDEYRRFIQKDRALDRRFQPIRVDEPGEAELRLILEAHARDMATQRGLSVPSAVLDVIVDLSRRLLRHRYFPDKALDVLDQSVAAALLEGRSELDPATVRRTVTQMAGLPPDWEARLQSLEAELLRQTLIPEDDIRVLTSRLAGTMRGLDVRPHRPNGVILVLSPEGDDGGLAYGLAVNLFGASDRLIEVDLSSYLDEHQISQLLGSPPGYVGYEQELPLHRLLYAPTAVLLMKHVDRCHPVIRSVLAQALQDGYFTDAQGRRLFIGDAVVVLTAQLSQRRSYPVGFRRSEDAASMRATERLREMLEPPLVDQVDQVIVLEPPSRERVRQWLEATVLQTVARQYGAQEIELKWSPGVVDWLANRVGEVGWRVSDWERRIEDILSHLWKAWPGDSGDRSRGPIRIRIELEGDRIVARPERADSRVSPAEE
jgi:ATP-dependent Clp protease ATP-binding subunit ClpC